MLAMYTWSGLRVRYSDWVAYNWVRKETFKRGNKTWRLRDLGLWKSRSSRSLGEPSCWTLIHKCSCGHSTSISCGYSTTIGYNVSKIDSVFGYPLDFFRTIFFGVGASKLRHLPARFRGFRSRYRAISRSFLTISARHRPSLSNGSIKVHCPLDHQSIHLLIMKHIFVHFLTWDDSHFTPSYLPHVLIDHTRCATDVCLEFGTIVVAWILTLPRMTRESLQWEATWWIS